MFCSIYFLFIHRKLPIQFVCNVMNHGLCTKFVVLVLYQLLDEENQDFDIDEIIAHFIFELKKRVFYSKMSDKIFVCKTDDGHSIKTIVEILHQSQIKEALFVLSRNGIRLTTDDKSGKILFSLSLDQDNFNMYQYDFEEDIHPIGLNISHLKIMLNNLKKKDRIELSIERNKPDDLIIQIPKSADTSSMTRFTVKIQEMQLRDIDIPHFTLRGAMINSGEFHKTCKKYAKYTQSIIVETKGTYVKFICDSIIQCSTEFGEPTETEKVIRDEFESDNLIKISKISGLSKNIQIMFVEDHVLLFKCDVGALGKLFVYAQSKNRA